MSIIEVADFAKDVFKFQFEYDVRLNWFTHAHLLMPAYHDPKKYPRSPEQFFATEDNDGRMSAEEMRNVLKSLVGNYGDAKPSGKK